MQRTVALISLVILAGPAAAEVRLGPATGKPVPRFESLAGPQANGRRGPGLDHRIDWTYQRRGLPVEVIEEVREWRRVKDPDGTTTWMHAANLSETRTAIARPKNGRPVAMKAAARADAKLVARLEPGVVARVKECKGDFIEIETSGREGWVSVREVWGATCAGE